VSREPQPFGDGIGCSSEARVQPGPATLHCRRAAELGLALSFHQSNHEGELVDLIQSARQSADAIIINPAGYSFTSIALLDAIKAFEGPVLEVHISNIHARDEHHRHSKISSAATGVICGLGPYGYIAAMHALAQMPRKA
jgi:3-dehydroquinate dehydratase-2